MLRAFVTDSAKYGFAAACASATYVISIPVLSRLIPPTEYGKYLLAVATVGFLGSWSVGWITPALVRFYPQYANTGQVHEFHATWLVLGTRTIAATALIVLLAGIWVPHGMRRDEMVLLVVVFATESILLLLIALLRATRRLGLYLTVTIWMTAGRLTIGSFLIVLMGGGARELFVAWCTANIVAVPVVALAAFPLSLKVAWRARTVPAIANEIRRYGIPNVGLVLLVLTLSICDRYILGSLRGPGEVALYAAGYEFSERSLFQLISIVTMAGGPLMFETWERHGVERARTVLRDLTSYFLILGVPATVGLCVLAEPIVAVILPPEYSSAHRVVRPVAAGAFLWGVMHSHMYALSLFKRADLQALALVPAAVVNIALNLLLVPRFGFVACAWVTLVSYGVALVTTSALSRRFIRWRFPFRTLFIVTLTSVLMAVVVRQVVAGFPPRSIVGLIAAVSAGIASYGAAVLALGAVPQLSVRRALALDGPTH